MAYGHDTFLEHDKKLIYTNADTAADPLADAVAATVVGGTAARDDNR